MSTTLVALSSDLSPSSGWVRIEEASLLATAGNYNTINSNLAIGDDGRIYVAGTFENRYENGVFQLKSNGMGSAKICRYTFDDVALAWDPNVQIVGLIGGGVRNDMVTGQNFIRGMAMRGGRIAVVGSTSSTGILAVNPIIDPATTSFRLPSTNWAPAQPFPTNGSQYRSAINPFLTGSGNPPTTDCLIWVVDASLPFPANTEMLSYLGGDNSDWGLGVALDATHAYVAGATADPIFTTANGFAPWHHLKFPMEQPVTAFFSIAFLNALGVPSIPSNYLRGDIVEGGGSEGVLFAVDLGLVSVLPLP